MNKFFKNFFALTLILSTGLFVACSKDDKKDEGDRSPVEVVKKNNTALLLCSFGSTYMQPQGTYDQLIADYKAAYPNTDIYMSFTSRTIISRVYAQIGKGYAQPDLWLKAIAEAGYENVYVQSLHIIPGEEYLSLMNTDVKKNFMIPNPDVVVAKSACLLDTEEDVEVVANILYNYYKARLDKGEVVALMGHGNPDTEYTHANVRYEQLEARLQELSGEKNIFIGTVDWGKMMFSYVREELKAYAERKGIAENNYKNITVNLVSLMSIAGDHAQNDMLGELADGQKMADVDPYENDWDAEYSWKLKLEKLGFTVSKNEADISEGNFDVIGLADHKEIRTLWLSHMKEAVENAVSRNEQMGE